MKEMFTNSAEKWPVRLSFVVHWPEIVTWLATQPQSVDELMEVRQGLPGGQGSG